MTKGKSTRRTLPEGSAVEASIAFDHYDSGIVFIVDHQYRITYINRVPAGLTEADVIGTSCLEYVPQEFHETVRQAIERAAGTGQPASYCVKAQGDDGATVWYSSLAIALPPGRQNRQTLIVTRDISARIEDAARRDRVAALLDLAHDAIMFRDGLDRVVFWSRGAEATYGYTSAEARGKVTHELLKTRFPAPLKELMAQTRKSGEWEGELVHTRKDGRTVFVDSRWALQRDEHGKPLGVLEVNRDITRRRELEVGLAASEDILSLALECAELGVWNLDWASGRVDLDARFCQVIGYAPEDIEPTMEGWLRHVHPGDRARLDRSIKEHHEGNTRIFDEEYRLRHKDGHWVWVHAVGKLMRDRDAHPVRVTGTLLDISQRRRLSEEGLELLKQIERMIREGTSVPAKAGAGQALDSLTRREVQVLGMVAQGLTSPEIAEQLHLTSHTVVSHRQNLMRKLDLHNTAEVIRFAIDSGVKIR